MASGAAAADSGGAAPLGDSIRSVLPRALEGVDGEMTLVGDIRARAGALLDLSLDESREMFWEELAQFLEAHEEILGGGAAEAEEGSADEDEAASEVDLDAMLVGADPGVFAGETDYAAREAASSGRGKAERASRRSQGRAGTARKGLKAPCQLSQGLAELLGSDVMPRTQVVKALWDYIKAEGLQDPAKRSRILFDAKLQAIFKRKTSDMFKLQKLLSQHCKPVDEVVQAGGGDEVDEGEEDEPAPAPTSRRGKRAREEQAEAEGGAEAPSPSASLKKKARPAAKRSGAKGGLKAPCQLSQGLAELLGSDVMPRTQVVKALWDYIKAEGLQDPAKRSRILFDAKLQAIFKRKTSDMFKLQKLLSQHCKPVDEVV